MVVVPGGISKNIYPLVVGDVFATVLSATEYLPALVPKCLWVTFTTIVVNVDVSIAVPPADKRTETYICHKYLEKFNNQGCYIYGKIGDTPAVKDIGRNRIRERLRALKQICKRCLTELKQ